MYRTASFDAALERCVNFLGDADSTGSMVGQLAGALYGYRSIDRRLVENLNAWDCHRAQLRAVMLLRLGQQLHGRSAPEAAAAAGRQMAYV